MLPQLALFDREQHNRVVTEGLSRLENVLQQFQVEEEVRVREKTKLLESKLRQLEAQLLERATAPADEKVFVCDISLVSVRVCVRVGFAVLVAHVSVAVLCFFCIAFVFFLVYPLIVLRARLGVDVLCLCFQVSLFCLCMKFLFSCTCIFFFWFLSDCPFLYDGLFWSSRMVGGMGAHLFF